MTLCKPRIILIHLDISWYILISCMNLHDNGHKSATRIWAMVIESSLPSLSEFHVGHGTIGIPQLHQEGVGTTPGTASIEGSNSGGDGPQATHFGMEACKDDATFPFLSKVRHSCTSCKFPWCAAPKQHRAHPTQAAPHLLPETRRSATTTPNSPTRPCEIQFFWAPTWQQNSHTSRGGSLSWMSFQRFKPISGRWDMVAFGMVGPKPGNIVEYCQHYWT